jgi:hypothetical protein
MARRQLFGVIAGSLAVAVSAHAAKAAPKPMRYEALLVNRWGEKANLLLMVMAHLGGFAERMPWFGSAPQDDREVFAALLTGDAARIEAALRGIEVRLGGDKEKPSPQWLDASLGEVIEPLILLGRADLVVALHANSRGRLGPKGGSTLAGGAALSLAMAGEWDAALRILQHEAREHGDVEGPLFRENLLWNLAYRHRAVATVMPVLAEIPFDAKLKHLATDRTWRLRAYQIRAGVPGVVVPVLEGDQPMSYYTAVRMQIAALAQDPAAAEQVAGLRGVLRPRKVDIPPALRGIIPDITPTIDRSPEVVSSEELRIVARRKNYARAAALARTPEVGTLDMLIEALLDEGDWQAAAEIVRKHDPRRERAFPGVYDGRVNTDQHRYQQLALGALRSGDDAAAATFLATAKRARNRKNEEDWRERSYAWLDTVFAGAAEGRLSRKHADMLTVPFSILATALP